MRVKSWVCWVSRKLEWVRAVSETVERCRWSHSGSRACKTWFERCRPTLLLNSCSSANVPVSWLRPSIYHYSANYRQHVSEVLAKYASYTRSTENATKWREVLLLHANAVRTCSRCCLSCDVSYTDWSRSSIDRLLYVPFAGRAPAWCEW